MLFGFFNLISLFDEKASIEDVYNFFKEVLDILKKHAYIPPDYSYIEYEYKLMETLSKKTYNYNNNDITGSSVFNDFGTVLEKIDKMYIYKFFDKVKKMFNQKNNFDENTTMSGVLNVVYHDIKYIHDTLSQSNPQPTNGVSSQTSSRSTSPTPSQTSSRSTSPTPSQTSSRSTSPTPSQTPSSAISPTPTPSQTPSSAISPTPTPSQTPSPPTAKNPQQTLTIANKKPANSTKPTANTDNNTKSNTNPTNSTNPTENTDNSKQKGRQQQTLRSKR